MGSNRLRLKHMVNPGSVVHENDKWDRIISYANEGISGLAGFSNTCVYLDFTHAARPNAVHCRNLLVRAVYGPWLVLSSISKKESNSMTWMTSVVLCRYGWRIYI